MNGYLLDTHFWLWFQMGNQQKLKPAARDELLRLQARHELYLSDVSVWAVARLAADGHIDLLMSVDRFTYEATRDGGLRLLPLTTHILIESTRLPGDMHGDPSDRLLAATAREHGLALVTRDRDLLQYGREGHLRTLQL